MMTDKELNARLRDGCNLQQRDGERAANRIEALTKERDEAEKKLRKSALQELSALGQASEAYQAQLAAEAKLATCEKYRDAYDEMGRIGTQAVRDLEAKLTKAVEALEIIRDCQYYRMGPGITAQVIARTTLAEIKGESHD